MIAEAFRQALADEPGLRPGYTPQEAEVILRYGRVVGSEVEHLPEARRCMDLARQGIRRCEEEGRSFASGQVIIADALSAGKGRFLRQWHAPIGGVWLVLTLANTLLPEHANLLPLAAGVACCETVRHFHLPAAIKWVNDVLLAGKKIAGILTETEVGPVSGDDYVLIGIGLNVNNTTFAPELRQSAAAMADFGGPFVVSEVAGRLLAKLAWNVGLLHWVEAERLGTGLDAEAAPHPLLAVWRGLSDSIGRQVRFGFNVAERIHYTARVVDIDNAGQLVMRLAGGQEVRELAGEIVYL